MKKLLLAAASVALFTTIACKKQDDTNPAGTFKGPQVAMGNGRVHAWTRTNEQGHPTAIGFTLDDAALTGLSAHNPPGHSHGGENTYVLHLPAQAGGTPYQQLVINWNPEGHPPAPIYTAPHFDFHFYTITEAERKTIPHYEEDSAGFKQAPAADYLPAGYFNPGGGEAEMGAHWIDPTSPELNGKPFTETFIYGTFAGKVTFVEPMMTMDYLKGITDFSHSIPRPARVKESGYYPTRFRITHAAGQYTLSFENMEWRDAS